MYYEKLALEVGATVAGFTVLKPPVVKGASGVEQRFTFVAVDGPETYAFDVCTEVKEVEIVRAYLKKMDTGANVFVVCLRGRPTPEARELARNYGMDVLSPMEVGDFFSTRIEERVRAPKLARTA